MLARLRSLKLSVLVAYALLVQGLLLGLQAGAAHAGMAAWCGPNAAKGLGSTPQVPSSEHDQHCAVACAAAAGAVMLAVDVAVARVEPGAALVGVEPRVARIASAGHHWSSRAPPSV